MVSATVSVIIPCYNGERFLATAIASVLAQTRPADEIVVVDDGSSDRSSEIIARYPTVRYLYQPNQGVAAARHAGFEASQGDYLIFFDQDDRLLPQAIAVGVAALDRHPDCAFVAGRCRMIGEQGLPLETAHRQPIEGINYITLLQGNCIPTPAPVMFRRSAIAAVGGINCQLVQACDDYDLYLRLTQRFPAHHHGQVVAEYRIHGANQSSTAGAARFLVTTAQIFAGQRSFVRGKPAYEKAHRQGWKHWCAIYGPYLPYELVKCLKQRQWRKAIQIAGWVGRYYPQGLLAYGQALSLKVAKKLHPAWGNV